MMSAILDTTALEKEQDELLEETQLISEMVQATIRENATVALDQTEYQKRYDSLSTKFDKSKARLEQVMADLQQIQLQRAEYESFLKTFKQLPDSLEEFSIDSWNSLVEYATVRKSRHKSTAPPLDLTPVVRLFFLLKDNTIFDLLSLTFCQNRMFYISIIIMQPLYSLLTEVLHG